MPWNGYCFSPSIYVCNAREVESVITRANAEIDELRAELAEAKRLQHENASPLVQFWNDIAEAFGMMHLPDNAAPWPAAFNELVERAKVATSERSELDDARRQIREFVEDQEFTVSATDPDETGMVEVKLNGITLYSYRLGEDFAAMRRQLDAKDARIAELEKQAAFSGELTMKLLDRAIHFETVAISFRKARARNLIKAHAVLDECDCKKCSNRRSRIARIAAEYLADNE